MTSGHTLPGTVRAKTDRFPEAHDARAEHTDVMSPDQIQAKQRLLAAATRDGDYELAEGLAVELEPYMQIIEDDREPAPIPMRDTEK
jgi:hypothetical protein